MNINELDANAYKTLREASFTPVQLKAIGMEAFRITLENYQDWVTSKARKAEDFGSPAEARACTALGLAGEAGEYADLLKKELFHGRPSPREKHLEELGDILFYLTRAASQAGLLLFDVLEANMDKLNRRYPNGFDSSRAHAQGEPDPSKPAGE